MHLLLQQSQIYFFFDTLLLCFSVMFIWQTSFNLAFLSKLDRHIKTPYMNKMESKMNDVRPGVKSLVDGWIESCRH